MSVSAFRKQQAMTPSSSIDTKVPADRGWWRPLSKIPKRYFAVPLIGGVVGLYGLCLNCFEPDLIIPTIVGVSMFSAFSIFMVACSDFVFKSVQDCQRRGFCKKLVVQRRLQLRKNSQAKPKLQFLGNEFSVMPPIMVALPALRSNIVLVTPMGNSGHLSHVSGMF
jgi:hypothetical protein